MKKIELSEVLDVFYKEKKSLTYILIFFFIIGLSSFFIIKETYQASLRVSLLTKSEVLQYSLLNNSLSAMTTNRFSTGYKVESILSETLGLKENSFANINIQMENIDEDGVSNNDLTTNFHIDEKYLARAFIEVINDRKLLHEIIKKNIQLDDLSASIYIRDNFGIDYAVLTSEESELTGKKYKDYYVITLKSKNKSDVENIFRDLVNVSNMKVWQLVNQSFSIFLDNELDSKNILLTDLKNKMDSLRQKYFDQLNSRISYLSEQLIIAKEIEQTSENFNLMEKVYEKDYEKDSKDYLRGYNALLKELELLRSRDDHDLFIPELSVVKLLYRDINSNNFIERAQKAFKNTPANDLETFKTVNTDINAINYKKIGFTKVYALGVLFLLLIVSFFVFILFSILNKRMQST